MDAGTLADAMLHNMSTTRYAELVGETNEALIRAECTTVNRAAMLLAQCGQESGGLRWTEELASGEAYNGRTDLGNVYPGDGPRFKGRSFIQITGRYNYDKLSEWAHGKGYIPSSRFFVDNPYLLSQDKYAWLGPVWYWLVAAPSINGYADNNDVYSATLAVNGGLNGYSERKYRYDICKSLGDAILPKPVEEDLSRGQVEQMIAQAFRSYHQGGAAKKRFGRRNYPNWIKSRKHGVGDRLRRLERGGRGRKNK